MLTVTKTLCVRDVSQGQPEVLSAIHAKLAEVGIAAPPPADGKLAFANGWLSMAVGQYPRVVRLFNTVVVTYDAAAGSVTYTLGLRKLLALSLLVAMLAGFMLLVLLTLAGGFLLGMLGPLAGFALGVAVFLGNYCYATYSFGQFIRKAVTGSPILVKF